MKLYTLKLDRNLQEETVLNRAINEQSRAKYRIAILIAYTFPFCNQR